jgi:hypothetical protein
MTPTDVVRLIGLVSQISPAQKFDEYTPDAWHMLLDDIRLEDALEAVRRVGRRQAFIAPADIVTEVKLIRRTRLERADATFVPSADPAAGSYDEQLIAHRKAIGDGADPGPTMPTLPRAVPPSVFRDVFHDMPKAIEASPSHTTATAEGDQGGQ